MHELNQIRGHSRVRVTPVLLALLILLIGPAPQMTQALRCYQCTYGRYQAKVDVGPNEAVPAPENPNIKGQGQDINKNTLGQGDDNPPQSESQGQGQDIPLNPGTGTEPEPEAELKGPDNGEKSEAGPQGQDSNNQEGQNISSEVKGHNISDNVEGHNASDNQEGHSTSDNPEGHSTSDNPEGHNTSDNPDGHNIRRRSIRIRHKRETPKKPAPKRQTAPRPQSKPQGPSHPDCLSGPFQGGWEIDCQADEVCSKTIHSSGSFIQRGCEKKKEHHELKCENSPDGDLKNCICDSELCNGSNHFGARVGVIALASIAVIMM